jgi:hypothetical protein
MSGEQKPYVLTQGFEDSSPHLLAIKIDKFRKENNVRKVIDIAYSSFKNSANNTRYYAIMLFEGSKKL